MYYYSSECYLIKDIQVYTSLQIIFGFVKLQKIKQGKCSTFWELKKLKRICEKNKNMF